MMMMMTMKVAKISELCFKFKHVVSVGFVLSKTATANAFDVIVTYDSESVTKITEIILK